MGQGSGVAMSWGVVRKLYLNLALLWLWCKPAVAAPNQPLAWKPPHAVGAALKSKKKKKKKKNRI